jgi:hypothetical protein
VLLEGVKLWTVDNSRDIIAFLTASKDKEVKDGGQSKGLR